MSIGGRFEPNARVPNEYLPVLTNNKFEVYNIGNIYNIGTNIIT